MQQTEPGMNDLLRRLPYAKYRFRNETKPGILTITKSAFCITIIAPTCKLWIN